MLIRVVVDASELLRMELDDTRDMVLTAGRSPCVHAKYMVGAFQQYDPYSNETLLELQTVLGPTT